MKILMALESDFPPDIRVENEIEALSEAGHEVHVACYSHDKHFDIPAGLHYKIHKKYITRLRYKSSVGALKLDYYFRFWSKFLGNILASQSFDAIHIHDLPLAKVGYEIHKKHGMKFVLDLHENWPALLSISTHTRTLMGRILCSVPQWERYELKYSQRADRVIVVVDEARDRLVAKGIPREKIEVVSNTLNTRLFSFPGQEKDPSHVTLVYGGGVNYHRGLQYVIRALPALKKQIPVIRFWIVGSGNYLEHLKKLAEELDVQSLITFWGWKSQKELLEIISRGDYAVIPHIRSPHTDATIPHKIFQYMYAGIPIVSSDCLPLKRILGETGTGVCFEDRNPDSIASVIINLHRDRAFLEKIPQNGRKWVEEKYNWDHESETLLKVYSS